MATGTRPIEIDPAAVERFGRLIQQKIATGDTPFRKAVVDRIEVDSDAARIIGDEAPLEQAIAANAPGVRRCILKWRSLGESNPCFSLERAAS